MRLLLVSVGLLALVLGATAQARPTASAAPTCPPASAEVTKGAAGVVEYSPAHSDGAPLRGKSLTYPQRFYRLNAAVELSLRGNTIWASKGSILRLGCYRLSRTGRPLPAVNLLRGSLKVKSTGEHPAGVTTEEGLFDPRVTGELVYTVKRNLTKPGEVTMQQLVSWFAFFPDQPKGTTTVVSAKPVGVTPYVGPKPGTCRYVHGARLTTTTRYGVGTATYRP
jgi:hypothetical protein